MQSQLPDSRVLKAGMVEDERRTRLSSVADNVRNLLRRSPFRSKQELPIEEDLPSPLSHTTSDIADIHQVPGALFPPLAYHEQPREVGDQSALYNTRAVAALEHPDLSDPSLAVFLQQKSEDRQRRAWKRSKERRHRRESQKHKASRWLGCVVSGVLLIAIVATYLALATTSRDISVTFHILFVLEILMATIIFAHSLVRVCISRRRLVADSPRVYVTGNSRPKRRHRHCQHCQRQRREMPALPDMGAPDFLPSTPVSVQVASDEIRPDSHEAAPTPAISNISLQAWDKRIDFLPNPPPAYGRWRGSVRANPDLLHWQSMPSLVDPETPALPSPTYEEAVAGREQGAAAATATLPSFMTRDSPERRRELRNARPELVRSQTVEPEMVEG